MAVLNDIANAVVSVEAGLNGAPDTVEFRDNDQVEPREAREIVIVTVGDPNVIENYSGAGTGDDFGGMLVEYPIGVSIYHRKLANPATELTAEPDFVQASKRALNRPTLVGADTVYGARLIASPTWENQDFEKGLQVSRFGVVFLSSETRAGD